MCCEEIKEKGTAFEISCVASDLHKRAKEFQESSIDLKDYNSIDVIFTATILQDLLAADRSNLIGKISVQTSTVLMSSAIYYFTIINDRS